MGFIDVLVLVAITLLVVLDFIVSRGGKDVELEMHNAEDASAEKASS